MQEPYKKGVANRLDPESCAGAGNRMGEALTGAHAGQPSSSEITSPGVPTSYGERQGHIKGDGIRKPPVNATESKTLCMRGKLSARVELKVSGTFFEFTSRPPKPSCSA